MNKSFSLQELSKTGNLDSILISRWDKLNLMAVFLRTKYENPKLKQSELANQLGYSSSTSQIYRNDINMVPPYRIQPNNANKRKEKTSNTIFDNNSHREFDAKRPRLTSCDFKTTSKESIPRVKHFKNKSNFKCGENVEINDDFSDELFHHRNS